MFSSTPNMVIDEGTTSSYNYWRVPGGGLRVASFNEPSRRIGLVAKPRRSPVGVQNSLLTGRPLQ